MLLSIEDGSISRGGKRILSHFNFSVRGDEKVGLTGPNGAGKSTLLELLAGHLELDADDKRQGPGITSSRRLTIGMLTQNPFPDAEHTVEEELMRLCRDLEPFSREYYEFVVEYDRIFTGFGFPAAAKQKKLSAFSGGEQTRIALIRLLLQKPDLLLLDEPTNHLDLAAIEWLENYLRSYPHAVVMVSHDRFFLDRTAQTICEVDRGRVTRYPGNYTHYREEKKKQLVLQRKAWEREQEEIRRQEALIERFKHKPTKAAFARSRRKQLERMPQTEKPEEDRLAFFSAPIEPAVPGSKWVLEADHLQIGYDRTLLELNLRVRRGQKIGLLGPNGAGKTTFLKTVAGLLQPRKGQLSLGNHVTIGYFDQMSAAITSECSVIGHFHQLYPALTDQEARGILGAFLFGGKQAARRVSELSGGERARLVLCELLQARPNLLILDEPTNHMDVQAKETLEAAFRAYTGTILFVSHDRYFIRQVAESVLIFEEQAAFYYPFGYEHYLEQREKQKAGDSVTARVTAEDQALIAGLRAVPRAERHRLREIPEQEAYEDWQLRLMTEKRDSLAAQMERLLAGMQALSEAWEQSEACMLGGLWEQEGQYRSLQETYEACCQEKTDLEIGLDRLRMQKDERRTGREASQGEA